MVYKFSDKMFASLVDKSTAGSGATAIANKSTQKTISWGITQTNF